ncbi:hypothetical protein Aph02nite_26550 [Actinoplanes philippinensis]|uniref:WD40 repeat n=1 Tax=Actinoplanes philippinensis TaxID=35752 RepID=A0A1I2G810_9ACTN|nr:WD40 repeat domain-containing protein [Actinoplanes philippinensis]GIE76705.1 hypothetical protein Aph02nite_26550 [Actinoplanes philippinensis]SFF13662.1 WD40 repeat [Actinoplanes philippinensis]
MESSFSWVEDTEFAPHRLLRATLRAGRAGVPSFSDEEHDAEFVRLDGDRVVLLRRRPSKLVDLRTGVPLADQGRFALQPQKSAISRLDGRPVIALLRADTLKIRDLATTDLIAEVRASFEPGSGVVFTEIDGRAVVTARAESDGISGRTPRSWDARTGEPAGRPYPADTFVRRMAAGRLGERPVVFAAGSTGILAIDPATGEEAKPPITRYGEGVTALVYGRVDGRAVLVTGGADSTVRVWDATTGEPVGHPFDGHRTEITSVQLTEVDDVPVVVSTSRRGAPRMWMLRSPAAASGHTDTVNAVCAGFWAGVPVFASASADRSVRLWDAVTGAPVGAALAGHEAAVTGAVFAGHGRDVLVTAGADGVVLCWSPDHDEPRSRVLTRTAGPVACLAATVVDGRGILGIAAAHGAEFWEVEATRPYATLDTGPLHHLDLTTLGGRLVALAVSPHPEGFMGAVTVWDVSAGKPLHDAVLVPEFSAAVGAFGTVDGRPVIVQGIDAENDNGEGESYWPENGGHLTVYDAATRTVLARFDAVSAWNAHVSATGAVALLSVTDSIERGVHVIDLRTGAKIGETYTGHGFADPIRTAALAVDGRVMVASCAGNAVHVWDRESRELP